MTSRLPFALGLVAVLILSPSMASGQSPVDLALDEIRVGRYWHGARILREEGYDRADDLERRLLLARAEAGWKHWPEVIRLLRGQDRLAALSGGEGLLLLGRALEEEARWAEAARAYAGYLDAADPDDPGTDSARARLTRVAVAAGATEEALRALDALPKEGRDLRGWAALEAARRRAAQGDTAAVTAFLARVAGTGAAGAAWRVLPEARLAAADTAGARRGWEAVRADASPVRAGQAATEAGRLALAQGDSATALSLLLEGLDRGTVRSRARAAAALLAYSDTDRGVTLRMAEVLARAGDSALALRAYDRAARQAGGGAGLAEGVRLARARLLATVRDRQSEALEEFRAIRAGGPDPRIGARNLEAWAALRRRQGRTAEVRTLHRWLLEDHPDSPEAAEALWREGDEAFAAGRTTEALERYATLARTIPTHARAGEARMRVGQIHLAAGRVEEAGQVYEGYLADFPDGRRWDEAAFWAARVRVLRGDTAGAKPLVDRIRREEPVSYYAVVGVDLLGEPYGIPSLAEGGERVVPTWLREGLARLDVLVAAGLEEGAEAEEGRLASEARKESGVLLTLAEELIRRGRTVAGINLGWELRREGAPWDRRLLRVTYPFPYRELVVREAREWGLDPMMLAAIMRQESAFKADIRSPAGAVGLMQVMPPTGRELAGRHGPDDFQEEHLETPEVNLHLGSAFFRDMSRRYDGDLPLVLSAYNAGPTRATRWRRYPEASDPLRFTERIPFDETRGYVKNVRRNLALYRFLYGDERP